MPGIELKFPLTNGGEETGFNDSGIETFLGRPLQYIARECGQNVGDVAREGVKTVDLHFDLIELPVEQLPCASELAKAFESSIAFWEDPKGGKFFSRALEQISKPTITVMKVSDYGTTGLKGGDEDRNGGWYGLIRSAGVTNKLADEGGGYGIGKYATFAGSGFRTVLYSTLTEDGGFGFQGVSHLVSHKSDNHVTQGTGYIGRYEPRKLRFSAIREQAAIPEPFRRKEIGLDIYILDFLFVDDWKQPLLRSILENFWPALHLGKIRFRVGSTTVDQSSLGELMSQFSTDVDFDAFYHYQSVVSEERRHFRKTLKHLGDVSLYIVKGWNDDFPKSIARVRTPGMVIDKRNSRSRVPYAGLFVCDNPTGNRLLKQLEPPRHDEFQPQRSPKNGKPALDELNSWLAECVKELNPVLKSKTLSIPGLHRYLPDTSDEDDSFDESEASGQRDESFDKSVTESFPDVRTSSPLPVHSVRSDIEPEDGTIGSGGSDNSTEDETGNHESGGLGKNEGTGAGENAGEVGGDHSKGPPRFVPLQTRTIATGELEFPICLCLRTNQDFDGDLLLAAVGDDGRATPLEITNAYLEGEDNTPLSIQSKNVLVGLQLSTDTSVRIRLAVPRRQRLAIKVTGRRK